ncbi:MAG TPA: ABC transporter substrate-binding protein [Psychromonas hadalis]|nr:ABC transporter substrate-binding protein [Psychromonas hadalis]
MNNFKLLVFVLFLALLIAFVSFFKSDLFVLFEEGQGNFTTQIEEANTPDGFPKKLRNTTGSTFSLNTPPQRILSATLSTDHILSQLINPTRLVAVSQYVDYPSLSNITGFYEKSISRTKGEIESMLALEPDLVFVASYSNAETVRYLLRSGIAVVRLSEFNSFADIFNNMRIIASVTDSKEQAEAIISNIETQIKTIQKQLKNKTKPRVLYYNLNGYSIGGNSLMDEAITLSGGINVARGVLPDGEHKISEELAISLQPDVIVMNKWVFNQASVQACPEVILKNKAAWKNVPAVKNNRVYAVKGTWLRSVSQYRIQGVIAIAKLLHPEIKVTNLPLLLLLNEKSYVQ